MANENATIVTRSWATAFNVVEEARELIRVWENGSPSSFLDQMRRLDSALVPAILHHDSFVDTEVFGKAAQEAERFRSEKGNS